MLKLSKNKTVSLVASTVASDKKKNQYSAFISAEDVKLPISCWPSVGLWTLSSLNDRRCKYILTVCQVEDHPGDAQTQYARKTE